MNGFAIGGNDYGFGGGWGDYGAGYGFGFGGGFPVSANTAAYGWSGFQGVAGFVNAGGSATQFAGWGGGGSRVGGGLWNYSFDWSGILAGLSDMINNIANGIYTYWGQAPIGNWGQAPAGDYAAPWAIGDEIDIEAEGEAEEDDEVGEKDHDAAKPTEAAKAPEAAATGKKTPVEIAREALPADRKGEAEALIQAMEAKRLPLKERLIKRVAKRVRGKTTVEAAAYTVQKAWRAEVAAAKEHRTAAAEKTDEDPKVAAPAVVGETTTEPTKEEPGPVRAQWKPEYYESEAECVGAGAKDCIPMNNGEYEGLKETSP